MKISTSIPSVTANDTTSRGKPAAPGARKATAATGEQVDLSSLAARLQEASAAGTAEVDSARVAEIKQAISEGRFQINPERIADGLIDSVRQMLERQQG